MSDDIVTRLREELDGPAMTVTRQDVREVLAEINHLRNKLEQFHKLLDIYNKTCDCDGCAACCQYELVVRYE